MRSTEVYRTLRGVVKPWCKSAGFQKGTGGMLSYHRRVSPGHETFWFQCSQWGWDAYTGSQFTVELQRASKWAPGNGDLRSRFARLMTRDELERVRRLQNLVISRLTRPPRDHWIHDDDVDADLRRSYFESFDPIELPHRTDDVWLRYRDEADVRRWGDFLLPLLPSLLERFDARVRRSRRPRTR